MKVKISTLASLIAAFCLAFTIFAAPAMAQDTYVPISPVLPSPTILVAPAAGAGAGAGAAAAGATATGDEVLGVSQTAGEANLAFTGSSVNTTALVGATLVGSGALLTLASRKRRQSDR